jgi:multicomponent Na+:H+ antiporter subunit D
VTEHLLPLLVAVPLLASAIPLFVAVRNRRIAHTTTVAVLIVQFALAIVVARLVFTAGPLSYVVGAIPASFGIALFADRLTVALAVLVAAGALAALLTGERDRSGPEYALWLLLVAGLSGVVVTADVFNLYVFLEISGLAAYAMVASARGVESALAALKYLLVGTVGATLYLLGVGYAFVATGTLSMTDLPTALATAGYESTLVVTAFVLMTVGLGVKLALFPLHAWKPDAYAAAPPAVATILAALGSTVAGYALVRIVYDVFTVAFLEAVPIARTFLLVASAVSVIAGGLLALRARDVRRLLAYSSISQYGLFGVGLALATPSALTGALVVLVGHAIAKGGLFLAVGTVARRYGVRTVAEYAGLAERAPLTTAVVAVLGISLVGLPPTVGFAGKWSLALGAIEVGSWVVAAIVLASTMLSLAYVGRLVERCYLVGADATPAPRVSADGGVAASATTSIVVLVVAAGLVVALGLGSSALVAWFQPVVEGWS